MTYTWARCCPECGGDLEAFVMQTPRINCLSCGSSYTLRQLTRLSGRLARVARDMIEVGMTSSSAPPPVLQTEPATSV